MAARGGVPFQTKTLTTAFWDTGGMADESSLVMARIMVPERKIYITGAKFWKVSKQDKIFFATVRNDIAKLFLKFKWNYFGVETNNMGHTEIESLRREYGMKIIGINTVGKLTDPKKIRRGESMSKEEIIKFYNSWVHNALADPPNVQKLGQILFLKEKTPDLQKLSGQVDNFIRKNPEGVGAVGRPKFGAEGSGHDDAVMAMLGALHIIKTRIFKNYGGGAVAHVPFTSDDYRGNTHPPRRPNDTVGSINHDKIEQDMLNNYGL